MSVAMLVKPLIFLRRMASITTLPAHFEFWSAYLGFSV